MRKKEPGWQAGKQQGSGLSVANRGVQAGLPARFHRSPKNQTSRARRAFISNGPGAKLMEALGENAYFFSLSLSDFSSLSDDPSGLYDQKVMVAAFKALKRAFRGPIYAVLEVGEGDSQVKGRGRLHAHVVAHKDDGPKHIKRDTERCKKVYNAIRLYRYLAKPPESYSLEALLDYSASCALSKTGEAPQTRRHFLGPNRRIWTEDQCTNNQTLSGSHPPFLPAPQVLDAVNPLQTSPPDHSAPVATHHPARVIPSSCDDTKRCQEGADRMKRHNWDIWKDRFIRSGDDVTLKKLSEYPNAPAHVTLRKRASQDKWEVARQEFRYKVDTRTREVVVETLAQVRARHAKMGSDIAQLGTAALAVLLGKDGALEKLKPREALALVQVGTEIERKAMEMDTLNLNLKGIGDITKLSDAELDDLELKFRQAIFEKQGGSEDDLLN